MLASSVSANFKNLNNTFLSIVTGRYSYSWTSATNLDNAIYINGDKRFMPLEFFYYVYSKTGTVGATISCGNAQGSAIYFTSTMASAASGFYNLPAVADGTSRISLAPGGTLWVRLGTQNPFGSTNTANIKFFISGYFR